MGCTQRAGLEDKFKNDEGFSTQIRMPLSLSFVKRKYAKRYYKALIISNYQVINKDLLSPILEYFESNWNMKKGRRKTSPKYSIDLWICYECIINNYPPNNNAIEGWHRGFST